jgi:hypothetical protein
MGIWYGVASEIRGHPLPPARFTRVDLLRPNAPPPRPNMPHHLRPPARFTRVDLLRPHALYALSPEPPSAQRVPEPQVVLRVLLDLVWFSRWLIRWGLDPRWHWGLGGWHLALAPLDEHIQSREHEAASEAETEAEPERKGERIASVGNVVVGRECWR